MQTESSIPAVTLDARSVAAADSILAREANEMPFSSKDRRLFAWLNWIGYGFALVPAVIGLSWGAWELYKGNGLWALVGIFVIITVGVTPFTCATFYIMLRLNWRTLRRVRRHNQLAAKLGLENALREPWRAEREKHRVVNAVTKAVGPALWGWGAFFLVVILVRPNLPDSWESSVPGSPPGSWNYTPPAVFACVAWTGVVGYLYLWGHRFRRGEEQLRVVQRLQEQVRRSQDAHGSESEGVAEVPAAALDQIARIERAQISRERAASIRCFTEDADRSFIVQKSREFRADQAALDPAMKRLVQNAIAGLASSDMDAAGSAGERRRRLPGASLEIGFSVDQARRRIMIHSLRPSTDEGDS